MSALNLIGRSRLAGVALLAGSLLFPLARTDPPQEERKPLSITVSGSAVLPDGRPGANLPVEIKDPSDLHRNGTPPGGRPPPKELPPLRYKTLAKGTTDDMGKFAIRFEPKGAKVFQLEVGRKADSAWIIKALENQEKDIDVGELRLRERVPKK